MGAAGGAAIAGGVIGAMGQIESGLYSAQVERNNAKIAQQNAVRATQAGYQEAENKGLQDANVLGQIISDQAANNVDTRSGSALAVQGSARAADQVDQGTIIHNALLQAYGYQTAAQSDKAQAQQDLTAAAYNAAGSLAGQAGNLPTSTAPTDPGASPPLSTYVETATPTQSSNVLFGYNNATNYGAVPQ
jgi:hypothetical protein